MRHLKKYENYDSYLDKILDKIGETGMGSLTKSEKDYLNAYSTDNVEKMEYIEKIEGQKSFRSNDGHFEFVYDYTEDYEIEKHHFGTITVPDLEYPGEPKVDGTIEGFIWEGPSGELVPNFEKEGIDILEFCESLEYELDAFLEYVVETINDENMGSET